MRTTWRSSFLAALAAVAVSAGATAAQYAAPTSAPEGDAFELELHPRPGVDIPFPIAMGSIDRQLLANGIATAFHGLTISWEPGARSLAAGRRFMDGLQALRPGLTVDHRVQLRWETFAHDAIDDVARWLGRHPTPAIAFNDHTTSTMAMVGVGSQRKLDKWAQRAGVTLEQ